jgi:hypothetical protein
MLSSQCFSTNQISLLQIVALLLQIFALLLQIFALLLQIFALLFGLNALKPTNHSRVIFLCILLLKK